MLVCSLMLLLSLPLSVVFLKNLGGILFSCGALLGEDTAELLGGIFSQLSDAVIVPGIAVPLLLSVLYMAVFCLYARQCRAAPAGGASVKRCRRVLLGAAPFAVGLSLGCALFFASVNGVRFGDIVVSLVKMAAGGLFDVL